MSIPLTGRFANLVDESVFWYHIDRWGSRRADLDLRDTMVERLRNFIFSKDDTDVVLHWIGFGTDEELTAIKAEQVASEELEEFVGRWPLLDDFLDRGNDWLATTFGLEAALNYDTQRAAVVLPLQEALDKIDDLPITREQFIGLLIKRKYAEEEE